MPRPQVTREEPDLDYDVYVIDLAVKHVDERLPLTRTARYVEFVKIDDTTISFTFKLNDKRKEGQPATVGGGYTTFPGLKIKEVYYTNAASGTANAQALVAVVWLRETD